MNAVMYNFYLPQTHMYSLFNNFTNHLMSGLFLLACNIQVICVFIACCLIKKIIINILNIAMNITTNSKMCMHMIGW